MNIEDLEDFTLAELIENRDDLKASLHFFDLHPGKRVKRLSEARSALALLENEIKRRNGQGSGAVPA